MTIYIEKSASKKEKIAAFLIIFGLMAEGLVLGIAPQTNAEHSPADTSQLPTMLTLQENSLVAVSNPSQPPLYGQMVAMVATAYSSTPSQTDEDPFITASGSGVKEGIVANNFLPFGTKIKIPELYGDKVFVVEDRMHWRKSDYQLDIWFPNYEQALKFGAKKVEVEILEN